MMDVAIAIDGEARNVSLLASDDIPSFSDDGDYIGARAAAVTIRAAIFPASGDRLRDLPEGIRKEAGWLCWSRSLIKVDDLIVANSVTYRVLFDWNRAFEGGFYRAALGRMTP